MVFSQSGGATISLLNYHRFEAVRGEAEVDVLIATTPENVHYATNYRPFSQRLIRDAEFFAVLAHPGSAPRALIAPVSEMDLVSEIEPDVDQVLPYGTFSFKPPSEKDVALEDSDRRLIELGVPRPRYNSATEALIDYLGTYGQADSRIGIDEVGITMPAFQALRDLLPSADIKAAYALWQRIRMVKTEEEIARLHKAVAAVESAFMATLRELREGISEQDLEMVLNATLIEQGAQPAFAVIAFGSHGAYPNAAVTGRKLRNGDSIRYDIGCTSGGYYSDFSRTVFFGNPPEKLQAYYKAILEGEEAAIQALAPGRTPEEIFRIAVDETRRAGIPNYERNHVGHGIGIEVYDPPILRAASRIPLETGMVLCVETPFYEIGWAGLQVEDTVIVKEGGAEFLTTLPRDLFVI